MRFWGDNWEDSHQDPSTETFLDTTVAIFPGESLLSNISLEESNYLILWNTLCLIWQILSLAEKSAAQTSV